MRPCGSLGGGGAGSGRRAGQGLSATSQMVEEGPEPGARGPPGPSKAAGSAVRASAKPAALLLGPLPLAAQRAPRESKT